MTSLFLLGTFSRASNGRGEITMLPVIAAVVKAAVAAVVSGTVKEIVKG